MSIIYDALKKVEKTNGKNSQEGNGNRPNNKPRPALIIIFLVLLIIFGFNLINNLSKRPKAKPALPSVPMAEPAKELLPSVPEVKPETLKKPAQAQEPVLNLNGIFFEKKKGYALINNQILSVKDTIEGARVKEIGLNKVVLEFEGREITLNSYSK